MVDDKTLHGSWHLVRWEIAYGDGRRPTLPFGDGATGLIVYATDGWMSACIARAGRPPLSSESVRSAPEAERLAAFESYFAYAGPFEAATRRAAAGRAPGPAFAEPELRRHRQVRNITSMRRAG